MNTIGNSRREKSIAGVDARKRAGAVAAPFQSRLSGWHLRQRYLEERLISRYSTPEEIRRTRAELRDLQTEIDGLHKVLLREDPESDDTGTLRDVDAAIVRLEERLNGILSTAVAEQ